MGKCVDDCLMLRLVDSLCENRSDERESATRRRPNARCDGGSFWSVLRGRCEESVLNLPREWLRLENQHDLFSATAREHNGGRTVGFVHELFHTRAHGVQQSYVV